MHSILYRLHVFASSWHHAWAEMSMSLLLALFIVVMPAAAAMRMQERSLYMESTLPGETTSYTISFRYMNPEPVGSIELLFCYHPIHYYDCVKPTGLDVSNAILNQQSGETGYSIQSKSANRIVLTRLPTTSSNAMASYTFDNIRNSTDSSQPFSIRMSSYSSTNATGTQVDFGTVRGQVSEGIIIQTQVPPMLIFCAAGEVSEDCVSTNENYYDDMGQLSAKDTLTAQSQMAVGTNASGGFAITANGGPLSAGTNVIDAPEAPTESKPGTNQFGINLVENNELSVGSNPEGTWANAVPSPDYALPNRYKYQSGDVIAYSPNVSLMKKFTISYMVNTSENLKAGVYSTTITYIASGRF